MAKPDIKKGGTLQVEGTGKVELDSYAIEVNGKELSEEIMNIMGIKEYSDDVTFYGRVTIKIENLEAEPKIENTLLKGTPVEEVKEEAKF